jgi:acyl-CoA synthetase (AMP-forming)/AMP-acid ligase II
VNGAGFLASLLGARRAGLVPVLADWSSPEAERERIAAALGLGADAVSVKATTNEQIGFIGRGEGIAALAVATIEPTP